ncbi:ImmA/IrrE family metallo-endopeptidase [Sporosarcina sp. resist]|uniref:ImmA/IrrE family metallo-endopeptidase n=1 Tax=Sporosarcina sp. resist TaxID=2762563 RepID=UPI00351C83AE
MAYILRQREFQSSIHNPFPRYQKWQAEEFAYHLCIPTFMLNLLVLPKLRCEAIRLIATLFNVEHSFANNRLEIWLQYREACYLAGLNK